ncbi:hypothetical protein [Candidatus Protochlamydia phocaeensis]|uniref:hypothetical protein n=1 Tax=Candidatus Protochlamydia phocaeensis TaxID=1414722 RepID=UPI00083957F8|nr:hypothetical protein [Candidatus Protochlamydia phocaeensis]
MSKLLSSSSNCILSNFIPHSNSFPNLESVIASFREPAFLDLTLRKRFRKVNETLCKLIQEAPTQSFLLREVLDFIDRVNREEVLNRPFTFTSFEFWLNNFSDLSEQDNYQVRAKIAGKWLPRSDYQAFFPIGMDRFYQGTHFVAAHLSPDVDTMIASFWGWLDAFAARIGTSLHQWSLPGGPPDSPVTSIFREVFGPGVFAYLPHTAQALSLTAMDLVTQKSFKKELGSTLTGEIDHGLNEKSIILVNEQGHYLGDWRSSDVEIVRQITILFKSCLRWFENNLHTQLISLFAKEHLSVQDFPAFNSSIFDVKIKDCEPALEFNERQKSDLNDFFHKILGVEKGLEGTFRDLNEALNKLSLPELARFQEAVESLPSSDIFDKQGRLKEDRPQIFHYLKNIIGQLDAAIHSVRNYVERLDVVLGIKYKVLDFPLLYINMRSDVDEMRHKIQNYDFLTVIIQEQDDSLFPVGIVRAEDLRKTGLGTVSLRDFCNLEEIRMAPYLEVISVIDHHKSHLRTQTIPAALIGDAQSCNVLIAEQAFALNDQYSLGGMTPEQIERQIKEVSSSLNSPSQIRILQRLLQRRIAAQKNQPFYVHPKREFDEYLFFLHAILDDTDLLTKVSARDVNCVAQLLNRLKSLSIGQETEIVHFDDLPKDKTFAKKAAQRILQQEDMYALYKSIYSFRESEVESNLGLCINGHYSNIFLDAKEQNGCARVGQTKIFASNFPYFSEHAHEIQEIWFDKSREVNRERPEIDLHIHMISTIASAEEVYKNQVGNYAHRDEVWFWIPPTQQAHDHLNSFLAGFQFAVKNIIESMSLEFLGPNAKEYAQIFSHHFSSVPRTIVDNYQQGIPIAVLKFKAGTLNSRKSMITPFLPRL